MGILRVINDPKFRVQFRIFDVLNNNVAIHARTRRAGGIILPIIYAGVAYNNNPYGRRRSQRHRRVRL